MDRITAEDRPMLWPDERWPQDVGALALLDGTRFLEADGRLRLDVVRDAVARRVHRVPRFRQRLLTPGPGRGLPVWVDDPGFDVARHVDVAQVPVPGGEAQLLHTVERIRRRRLDRDRPLWEMWFLPGLPGARVGVFFRMHHVVADGIAGVGSLAEFLDAPPAAALTAVPGWSPAPEPSERELVVDNVRRRGEDARAALDRIVHPVDTARRATSSWPALRELVVGQPGPHTSLDVVVGPHRALGLVRADLTDLRRATRAAGATVNDALLALTAGGLRALLLSRCEPVRDLELPIFVPVSLRHGDTDGETGNLISQMVVWLPVGVDDPGVRLHRIAERTSRAKALARSSLGATFRNRLLGAVLLRLVVRRRVNLGSADLPGPQQRLSFAGAEVLEIFPLLNLIGNVSLGVGAISYAGRLHVMVVADGDAFPDLDVLVDAARVELSRL